MAHMNSVTLAGNVTKDPVLKYFDDGNAVAQTSIAVHKYAGQGKEDKVFYVDVKVWGKRAEFFSQYTHKGDFLVVTGSLDVDKYRKNDNTEGTSISVTAHDFHGGEWVKGRAANQTNGAAPQAPVQQAPPQAGYQATYPQQQAPVQQAPPQQVTPAPQQAPVQQAPPPQQAAPQPAAAGQGYAHY